MGISLKESASNIISFFFFNLEIAVFLTMLKQLNVKERNKFINCHFKLFALLLGPNELHYPSNKSFIPS
ncbi:hypothetical protein CW304_05605 [Bacillus sp. UFRGS-B20]|nr:hypothetical protein CW304_05605 [Bacillus sp. UFRGS-B20]